MGLEDLPLEKKAELFEQSLVAIHSNIGLRILENLTPEKQKELEKLQDSEEIINVLKEEIPNFEDIVKEEVYRYKNLVLAGHDEIKRWVYSYTLL